MSGNEDNIKFDIKRNYTTPSVKIPQIQKKDNINNISNIENSELNIENQKLIEEIKTLKIKEEQNKTVIVDS